MKEIQVDLIDESPFNHRKIFTGIDELAASIREKGILHPLLARPVGDRFELVYGHRRFRAAQLAKLDVVPVLVRELDDQQVIEEQVIENASRSDVHPLEEATGFDDLRARGLTVDAIAAKVAKSKSYVYRRLALAKLDDRARELVFDGSLDLAGAERIARVPDAKAREAVVAHLLLGKSFDEYAVNRALRQFAHNELSAATWDLADAKITEAGACTSCPKRSNAQAALFGDDVERHDQCLDASCWEAKRAAVVQLRVKAAKKAGQRVIVGDDVAGVLVKQQWGDEYSTVDGSGFVLAHEKHYLHTESKTTAEIIGDPEIVLAVTPSGSIVELVDEKAAEKAIAKAEKAADKAREAKLAADRAEREEAKAAAMDPVEKAIRDEFLACVGDIREAAKTPIAMEPFLRFVIACTIEGIDGGTTPEADELAGKGDFRDALRKMKGGTAQQVFLELVLGNVTDEYNIPTTASRVDAHVLAAGELYDVDVMGRLLAASEKAKAPAADVAPEKPAKKPRKSKAA